MALVAGVSGDSERDSGSSGRVGLRQDAGSNKCTIGAQNPIRSPPTMDVALTQSGEAQRALRVAAAPGGLHPTRVRDPIGGARKGRQAARVTPCTRRTNLGWRIGSVAGSKEGEKDSAGQK